LHVSAGAVTATGAPAVGSVVRELEALQAENETLRLAVARLEQQLGVQARDMALVADAVAKVVPEVRNFATLPSLSYFMYSFCTDLFVMQHAEALRLDSGVLAAHVPIALEAQAREAALSSARIAELVGRLAAAESELSASKVLPRSFPCCV
jgi:hypothetical protein